MRRFTMVIEQDEDGYYAATVPSLPSCYAQARTLEELTPRIREVIALCLAGTEFSHRFSVFSRPPAGYSY
jgi:predicted RNase H-like HicB family nuclease